MKTRVLLADDHVMMLQGLRSLVASAPDFEVVGEAANGRELVELAAALAPDVLVTDIGMPELNGVDALRQVLAAAPNTRAVVLSMHADHRMVAAAFRAGALGYVVKDAAFDELIEAIRTVLRRQRYLSSKLSTFAPDALLSRSRGGDGYDIGAFGRLTARQREVLQLISEGKSTKEAARALNVSVKTVETHRRALMEALDLQSVAELTKYAIREGLTTVSA